MSFCLTLGVHTQYCLVCPCSSIAKGLHFSAFKIYADRAHVSLMRRGGGEYVSTLCEHHRQEKEGRRRVTYTTTDMIRLKVILTCACDVRIFASLDFGSEAFAPPTNFKSSDMIYPSIITYAKVL